MSERTEKVSHTLKERISEIIQREVKDPRVGFITVTSVEVSPDLHEAKVFITVLGNKKQRQETLDALNKASGYVRGELGKRIHMKFTPNLEFRYDESVKAGMYIEKLLHKIEKKKESE